MSCSQAIIRFAWGDSRYPREESLSILYACLNSLIEWCVVIHSKPHCFNRPICAQNIYNSCNKPKPFQLVMVEQKVFVFLATTHRSFCQSEYVSSWHTTCKLVHGSSVRLGGYPEFYCDSSHSVRTEPWVAESTTSMIQPSLPINTTSVRGPLLLRSAGTTEACE